VTAMRPSREDVSWHVSHGHGSRAAHGVRRKVRPRRLEGRLLRVPRPAFPEGARRGVRNVSRDPGLGQRPGDEAEGGGRRVRGASLCRDPGVLCGRGEQPDTADGRELLRLQRSGVPVLYKDTNKNGAVDQSETTPMKFDSRRSAPRSTISTTRRSRARGPTTTGTSCRSCSIRSRTSVGIRPG